MEGRSVDTPLEGRSIDTPLEGRSVDTPKGFDSRAKLGVDRPTGFDSRAKLGVDRPVVVLELVVASANRDKVAEVAEIMKELPVRLITRDEISSWPQIEETGSSYLENALIKAGAVMAATGKAALADDSGIEVDALDGGPGIRSARLAGPNATAEQNNLRLVSLLSGVSPEQRTARYRCVAAIVFPDERLIAGIGTCEGSIGMEPRGTGGFGYDPWFIPKGETRTMAELSPQEKHAISHRGRALRGLIDQLRRTLE